MSIKVTWQGDCHFNIVTDKGFEFSIDSDGKLAPCPTEILLSALGSCSATDVALYFKDKGIELEHLTNRLTYQLTENEPRLYKSVNLHFSVNGSGITEIELKSAIEDALNKYCHVCLMLQPKINITYTTELFI